MAEADAFVHQHRGDHETAATHFLRDFKDRKPSNRAIRLNQCRSTCRLYWSSARQLIDMGISTRELDEFASRHQRFKSVFQSIDKLDGSSKI